MRIVVRTALYGQAE